MIKTWVLNRYEFGDEIVLDKRNEKKIYTSCSWWWRSDSGKFPVKNKNS